MSDSSQGADWWQASDGKWYPPEQHPDNQPAVPSPPPGVKPAPPDHRSAKAEAKAAKAHAKAMRPWYKKKRLMIPLALVALIVVIAIASGGSGDDSNTATKDTANPVDNAGKVDSASGNSDHPPQNDVQVTGCATDEIGFMEADVVVKNNSSKRSNYMIEVTFESEDGSQQLGTGGAFVNDLEPNQTKNETVSALEDAPEGATFKCRVTNVERLAA